ncbi:MAG: neutral/alkaline non-lysosomal ceramidase N-terminal domain-containing protein [Bryobacteraceae bacterium]|nr:neutral/alkaline non-lysosomal ceramidase N-terminal domain-containing protein [Bryobacteraceae bacterium]
MKLAGLLLGFAFAATAADAGLLAGIARVEITPSKLMRMYGYANRKCGPANGTHDPLFAKALVLQAGESRLAIVTMDLGSMVSANLPRDVAAKLAIPVLLLAASHTHSAPAFLPYGSAPAEDEAALEYLADLEGKVFRAVEEASRAMFPARLGVGRGSIQLGYNRLLPRDDGRSRALFDNLERVPYGPVDPEFVLLRVDDASGNQRALLVHYAAHAVVLGPTSCKYSADFPGVMQRKAEEELKGTQVMFVQGGAGDINPLFMGRSGDESADFKVMEKMGELLAAEVLRANKSVEGVAADAIRAKGEVLTFSERWEKDKSMEVGITTVLIGQQIAIATAPGEALHKLQRMWKEQADVPHALFYGYTYSSGGTWAGYIPDLRSAAYGGYGADASTRIEVGAGEKIMLRHLANLYDLRGMWRDAPGRP